MKEPKKDLKSKKGCKAPLKKSGPHLEVTVENQSSKKVASKKIVVGRDDTKNEETEKRDKRKNGSKESSHCDIVKTEKCEELNNSLIVCSHIADIMDLEAVKAAAKSFGLDLDAPPVDEKTKEKEMKRKIKAWKKCPCRLDFRNVCRDPNTGEVCPIVTSIMTPQSHDPRILELGNRLPPGTIGVGRRQVVFHGNQEIQRPNDPHALELGRRPDGTMCVSIQYSPELQSPPEYVCTTGREVQANLELPNDKRMSKKSVSKGKGKGGKKKK